MVIEAAWGGAVPVAAAVDVPQGDPPACAVASRVVAAAAHPSLEDID